MIILMGVAGAGKSMQGHKLADEYGYAYLSTGELFRVLITGRRRHEMLEGNLLSDDEVITVVDKVLELVDLQEEFILDGFPRTPFQVDWLMMQHKMKRLPLPVVINLEIEEHVIKERLKQRNRPDDTDAAIERRYNEYQSVTRPILSYMAEQGITIHEINANDTPTNVHDSIVNALKPQE